MSENNNSVWLIACRPSGIIAILLAFGIAILLSNNASAANMVTNGGFETGDFTGWNSFGASSVSSSYAYGGSYSNHVYVSGSPGTSAGTYQYINLTGVDSLTFWYYLGSNSGNWACGYYLVSASNAVTFAGQDSHEPFGVWHQIDVNVSMYSGSTKFQVSAAAGVPSPPAPSPLPGTINVYYDVVIADKEIPSICSINFNPNVSISNQTQQYFNYSVNDTYEDYMYFVTSVWHAPYDLSDLYLIENWLNVEQEGENVQLNNPFNDLQTYHLNLYATTSAPPVISESFLIASSDEIYINRSYAGSIPPIPDPEPEPDPYDPDPNPIEDPDIPIPDDWNMTIPEKYQNVSWLTNYTGYFDDMRYSINGSLYGVTGLVIKPLQSLNETVHVLRYHIANSTNMVAELSYLSVIVYYGWGVLPEEMQTIFIGVAAAGACIYLFKRRT